jgi:hypothetical protein
MYNKNLVIGGSTIEDVKASILKATKLDRDSRQKNALSTTLPTDWESALSKTVDSAIKASER